MNNTRSSCRLLSLLLALATLGVSAQAQSNVSIPKITYEDVSYGDHGNQVFDFWKADVDGPAPLVVFIHGGGLRL